MKRPLSKKLVRYVISAYLAITITVTIVHMVVDYQRAKNNVFNQVEIIGLSLLDGISSALWNVDRKHLSRIAQGALEYPYVVGIRVVDNYGENVVAIYGKKFISGHHPIAPDSTALPNKLSYTFEKRFANYYQSDNSLERLGETIIYTDLSILFDELKYSYLIILINSVIKWIALILIIMFFAERLINRPLLFMIHSLKQTTYDNIGKTEFLLKEHEDDEIGVVEENYNAMMRRLLEAKEQLNSAMDHLTQSNQKLNLLVENSKDLTLVHDKFSAMEKVVNQMLGQLSCGESTKVLFSFKEDEQRLENCGYTQFSMKVVFTPDGRWRIDNTNMSSLDMQYSNRFLDSSVFYIDEIRDSELLQRQNHVLIPVFYQQALVGAILFENVQTPVARPEEKYLVSLSQILAVSLENIRINYHYRHAQEELANTNSNLEQLVQERTKELQQSLEEIRIFKYALNHNPNGVMITDAQGRIEYVNQKFVSISGYTQQDLMGKQPSLLKSGKTPDSVYEELWKTIISGKEWRGVLCNKTKNGILYWESIAINSIKDTHGDIVKFISVSEDVTYRENKAQNLENSLKETEYRNLVLVASNQKLETLVQEKEVLFQKLSRMYNTHLIPIKKINQELIKAVVIDSKDAVRKTARLLFEFEEQLKPLTYSYNSEQLIRNKQVLLVDEERKRQIMVKTALGGTGVRLQIASSAEESYQLLKAEKFDIICVSTPQLPLLEESHHITADTKLVLLTDQDTGDYLEIANRYPQVSNIISTSFNDKNFALKNILITIKKLMSQDLFGLDKYLNWGAEIKALPVVSSEDRGNLIKEMQSYFEELGVRRSTLKRAEMIVEELLMNAIYDAPVNDKGKPLYNHLSRQEQIILSREEQGVFKFGTDGVQLAVSVEDPFGSLRRATVLRYLTNCFNGQRDDHQQKQGAGLGLFQIIQSTDLMVINVHPHVKTEVIAVFNIAQHSGKAGETSFHYFIE